MNPYRLVYTKPAVKDINKLDSVAKKRLKKAMERFVANPQYFGKKLVDPKLGEFRFRIGDYRIIFDIKDRDIVILRVGHRREIYL